MTGRTRTVFATYKCHDDLEDAVGALIIYGFPSQTISALLSGNLTTNNREPEPPDAASQPVDTEILRGTLGLLDDLGIIAIPDHGPFIAAGPLMTALAGAQPASEATVIDVLREKLGISRTAAKLWQRVFQRRALVSVQCADSTWTSRARQLLRRAGAERISSSSGTKPLKVRHAGSSIL